MPGNKQSKDRGNIRNGEKIGKERKLKKGMKEKRRNERNERQKGNQKKE